MSEFFESEEPLVLHPVPPTNAPESVKVSSLDLVEIFTSFIMIQSEVDKLLELKVDQRGIDFIFMLLATKKNLSITE